MSKRSAVPVIYPVLVQDVPSRGLLFLKTLLKVEAALAFETLATIGLCQTT